MNLLDFAGVVRRRWIAALAALAMSALIAYWAGETVTPEYTSTASLSVIPAKSRGGAAENKNPWDASRTQELAAAVRITIDGPGYRNRYREQRLDDRYEIKFDWGSPTLEYKSTSIDRDQAVETVNRLLSDTEDILAVQQAGYNLTKDEMIGIQVLGSPSATGSTANVGRARLAIGGGVAILSALCLVAADNILMRRRRRLEP